MNMLPGAMLVTNVAEYRISPDKTAKYGLNCQRTKLMPRQERLKSATHCISQTLYAANNVWNCLNTSGSAGEKTVKNIPVITRITYFFIR